jgi:transcriptional regulator with XRE-family HTH domain
MRRGRKPRLPVEAIRRVREWRAARLREGRRVPPSRKELARELGVAPDTISQIANRGIYAWVP